MLQGDDSPEGPLTKEKAAKMTADLTKDSDSSYDQFTTEFFSVNGELKVSEQQRQEAIALCKQADKKAALQCMTSFGTTDFRDDLPNITVPVLVLHGDSDATVPFEGSGARTHRAIPHSELVVLTDAPHGCNVSHADEWNAALIDFLAEGTKGRAAAEGRQAES